MYNNAFSSFKNFAAATAFTLSSIFATGAAQGDIMIEDIPAYYFQDSVSDVLMALGYEPTLFASEPNTVQIHVLMDHSIISDLNIDDMAAFAIPDFDRGECKIILPDLSSTDYTDLMVATSSIPREYIGQLNGNKQASFLWLLAHERDHCVNDLSDISIRHMQQIPRLTFLKESLGDLASFTLLNSMEDEERVTAQEWRHARYASGFIDAFRSADINNSDLPLAEYFEHSTGPSMSEDVDMQTIEPYIRAYSSAFSRVQGHRSVSSDMPLFMDIYRISERVLQDNDLSETERRILGGYLEAVEYFVPDIGDYLQKNILAFNSTPTSI